MTHCFFVDSFGPPNKAGIVTALRKYLNAKIQCATEKVESLTASATD
jgi:hypothetical protein